MGIRILIIDDDAKLRRFVREGLESEGFECVEAGDGATADRILRSDQGGFDVILLDVVLGSDSGWDVLESLRAQGRATPVIFVTALDSVPERVKGLRLGADDYVVKPFALEELVARIETVLRRTRAGSVEAGDLKLELTRRSAERAGKSLDLSPREFDLLHALMRGEGRTLTRAELLEDVWKLHEEPSTNLVDVHIGRLRRKLDRLGPSIIETVRGAGYRLAAPDRTGA